MTGTRCALYARVSTTNKGQSPDNQLADLRHFAATQGWDLTTDYIDTDSGSKSDRPCFTAMLAAASRREFDILLFWSLDRLSREGACKTLQVLNQLAQRGVGYLPRPVNDCRKQMISATPTSPATRRRRL